MQTQTVAEALAIPSFLIISAAKRAKAWENNPPRPMPKFTDGPVMGADSISEDFRAQLEQDYVAERDALSAFKRPDTAKAKKYASDLAEKKRASLPPPEDHTGMRWGRIGRRYGWLPDVVNAKAATAPLKQKKAAPVKEAAPRKSTTLKEENLATVMALLTRRGGATLDEIAAATGWLRHSASAFLSGIRKATKNPIPLTKATGKYQFTETA